MKDALTVTALTRYIKYKFTSDPHLTDVRLEGEISNFKHHSRGHFYFTLKDENASISAIMFKSDTQSVSFTPTDGDSVIVEGSISIFEKAGSYQIYVKQMTQAGMGQLYQNYLKLKATLEAEGYFDPSHKTGLPTYPKTVALLTSSTGAAIRDMISTIKRRFPLTQMLVYPTHVQGDLAKVSIATNIQRADQNPDVDVIIVGRGGGSIEDLWAFNERIVADAIYHATTPIISAVGHETDFTIADFVADLRAPTPTGAAEMAVPDQKDIKGYILEQMNRLKRVLNQNVERKEETLSYVLNHPVFRFPERLIDPYDKALTHWVHRLNRQTPLEKVNYLASAFETQAVQLKNAFESRITRLSYQLDKLTQSITLNSPQTRLEQGYTLILKDGKLIKRATDLTAGDSVEITFSDGTQKASIQPKGEK